MAEGPISNTHCAGLSGNSAQYCDEMVNEQCGSGDTTGGETLEVQARQFLIDLVEPVVQHFVLSTFAECADLVSGLIKIYGTPEFTPVAAPAAIPSDVQSQQQYDLSFITLNIEKAKKFKKIKDEPIIVVVGRQNDAATAELMQNVIDAEGGRAWLLFIDTSNMSKAKKMLKALGIMGSYSNTDTSAQCISHKQQPDGNWQWSAEYQYFSTAELEAVSDPLAAAIATFKAGQSDADVDPLSAAIATMKSKQPAVAAPGEDPLASAISSLKSTQPAPQTQAVPPAPITPVEPVIEPVHDGLLVPDSYKADLLVAAEKKAGSQPAAGFARTLTPENFHLFFGQNGRPVVLAVVDPALHQADVIDVLQEEQQKIQSESERAFIAVLDLSDAETRNVLWNKLSKMKQAQKGFIDPDNVRPFAVLKYSDGKIAPYHDVDLDGDDKFEIEIKLKTDIKVPVPELMFESVNDMKKQLKKMKYPMTVFVVHDPYDMLFMLEADSVAKEIKKAEGPGAGSAFYLDWNDENSRYFATHYLGISPLPDALRYERWEIGRSDNEHGYFTNISYMGGEVRTDMELYDLNVLNSDPFAFTYVGRSNFEAYFDPETRANSVVVVGDPRDPDTQELMERLSNEKRDMGYDYRLIMVPQDQDCEAKDIMKSLGIPNKKLHTSPVAYLVEWSSSGKRTTNRYTPLGFEISHADNDVWAESVEGTGNDVLVVVGSVDPDWDPNIAKATNSLKQHLAEQILTDKNSSVKIDGKNIKELVYLDYTDVFRIYAETVANGQSNEILDAVTGNKKLPQMFLISGADRTPTVVGGPEQASLPVGWVPYPKPAEPVIIETVNVAPPVGVTEKKVVAAKKCDIIGEPFTVIGPMSSAWMVNLSEFIVVIGDGDSSNVQDMKDKVETVVESCAEGISKLFFVDTDDVQWPNKLYSKIFGLSSIGDVVYECHYKNEKSFDCDPYHFPQ